MQNVKGKLTTLAAVMAALSLVMACGSGSLGWRFTWFVAYIAIGVPTAMAAMFRWMATKPSGMRFAEATGMYTGVPGGIADSAGLPEGIAGGIVRRGERDGWEWVVARNPMGGCNGYVRVPDRSPMRAYAEPDRYLAFGWDATGGRLDLPGEITYGRDGWIGFDTMHADDVWREPDGTTLYDYSTGVFPPRVWTVGRVAAACEETIDRIREYTGEDR